MNEVLLVSLAAGGMVGAIGNAVVGIARAKRSEQRATLLMRGRLQARILLEPEEGETVDLHEVAPEVEDAVKEIVGGALAERSHHEEDHPRLEG